MITPGSILCISLASTSGSNLDRQKVVFLYSYGNPVGEIPAKKPAKDYYLHLNSDKYQS